MDENKTIDVNFDEISSGTVELLGSTWHVIDPKKMNKLPKTKADAKKKDNA